jgi:hypothetical protein
VIRKSVKADPAAVSGGRLRTAKGLEYPSAKLSTRGPLLNVIPAEEPVKNWNNMEAQLSVILERANIVSAFGDPT